MNHLDKKISFELEGFTFECWGRARQAPESSPLGLLETDWQLLANRFTTKDFRFLKQIHGSRCLRLDTFKAEHQCYWSEADSYICSNPQNMAAIRVADCIPILFVHPQSQTCGGIHAGWRGLKQEIVKSTLTQFDRPAELFIWVGPHIGKKYEVGPDVYSEFDQQHWLPHPDENKQFLDMAGILKEQFTSLGFAKQQIKWQNSDTLNDENFFSHRAGEAGRNIAIVYKSP